MDYLLSIEYVQLPFRVTDERALQCVRVLKAAGLIEASIVASDVPGRDSAADIRAITGKGRVAIAHHAQGKPLP
ncbi:hypothetical protein [Pseudorhodoferax soli]|nr:hypothetical protein [Pseudorhodoferax soli]